MAADYTVVALGRAGRVFSVGSGGFFLAGPAGSVTMLNRQMQGDLKIFRDL